MDNDKIKRSKKEKKKKKKENERNQILIENSLQSLISCESIMPVMSVSPCVGRTGYIAPSSAFASMFHTLPSINFYSKKKKK
jgi:hypothetical protein